MLPVAIQALKEAHLLTKKASKLTEEQLATLKQIFEKENELYEFTKEFLETYQKPNINAIAVTHGPGLEPCLWVGINFAKALSFIWDLPIIPANHIEGHILVNFLENPKIALPALSLVVSGGHTQLILVKKLPARRGGGGSYEIIGETRDDAAGECFDKCARLMNLGYPGGPIISKIAAELIDARRLSKSRHRASTDFTLPRPMLNSKDHDFSFSGLKTAVLYKIRDTDEKTKNSKEFISQMCFEIQDAICEVLIKKTLAAAKEYNVKTIILGGGVSANQRLREQFNYSLTTNNYKLNLLVPPANLSTDNALMIAITAYFHKNKIVGWKKLKADSNLRISK